MDPITTKVHHGANLWQTQINLVGMGECKWTYDLGWILTTLRYRLLGLKSQEGHLVLAWKPGAFHSIMGLCSSWWCFSFSRCKWGEWDSGPFHHKDPDTYATSGYAPIQSQRYYFYGCHVWHQQCEVPPITLMVFDFHHTKVLVIWVIVSRQTCEDLVEWLSALHAKFLSHMPHRKPSCFIVDDAPHELWAL